MEQDEANAVAAGPTLPPDTLCRVLDFLGPNERALAGRLVNKDASKRLSRLHRNRTARFGVPLPDYASDVWKPHLQHALKHLTLFQKFQVLSVAATSGCVVNMALAFGLLQQSLPLHPLADLFIMAAGSAAVKAGHISLLYALRQCSMPVCNGQPSLVAAAEYLDLWGMLTVWGLLQWEPRDDEWEPFLCAAALAAGRSATHAGAKLEWLVEKAGDKGLLQSSPCMWAAAASGAAACGCISLLRWLRGEGLDLHKARGDDWGLYGSVEPVSYALTCALQQGHVAAADWLVDEAGYPLPHQPYPPQQQEEGEQQEEDSAEFRSAHVWEGAASGGSMEAVRWLLRRGVPVHEGAMTAAAGAGRLEVLQVLHGECGLQLTAGVFAAAAGSRSVPIATWLLAAGCPSRASSAYSSAAAAGDVDMVQWLVHEAGCPWTEDTVRMLILCWPNAITDSSRQDLGRAVRLLVEAGCPPGGTESMDAASTGGRLSVLRFLHEELGVGFGAETLARAARGGCEAVIEWLVGKGCVAEPVASEEAEAGAGDPYVQAALASDGAAMSCLWRLGVPWGEWALAWAAGRVSLRVLRCMVEQGAPWAGEAVARAVARERDGGGDAETVAWFEARLAAEEGEEEGNDGG